MAPLAAAGADDSLRARFALATAGVFLIEAMIALWWRDRFVRPYLGDVLAVVLVHLFLRATTRLTALQAAGAALAVAVMIELGQLLHVLDALGLRHNALARVVLGGTYDPQDLACYLVGALAAFALDRLWLTQSSAADPG